MNSLTRLFYTLKPAIPRTLQLFLRRRMERYKLNKYSQIWPIDPTAGTPPHGWTGWPQNKKFALVLMHDVDTQAGHDKCYQLMDLEERLGVRSTFNFVPEKYQISRQLLEDIKSRGFEIGVHGLKHDGKLFASRETFLERAKRINQYLADWGTHGFSSPSMHRNLAWMHALKIQYATSTFDTDPFEPQPEGVKTIFPFWVNGTSKGQRYLELPYTMVQDFTLFIIMQQTTIDLWLHKLHWIAEKGGMALLNTHPDYMNFNQNRPNKTEEYPATLYEQLIKTIQTQYPNQYWQPLPSQLSTHYTNQQNKQSTGYHARPVAPQCRAPRAA